MREEGGEGVKKHVDEHEHNSALVQFGVLFINIIIVVFTNDHNNKASSLSLRTLHLCVSVTTTVCLLLDVKLCSQLRYKFT